jgi:hypothetical protein
MMGPVKAGSASVSGKAHLPHSAGVTTGLHANAARLTETSVKCQAETTFVISYKRVGNAPLTLVSHLR